MAVKLISVFTASLFSFFTSLYISAAKPATAVVPDSLARNGTPKKYFTLSFDDGITQDYRIMEICRKYNFSGITFNINTGLCGESWDWVADAVGVPGLSHQRLTRKEIRNGAYNGFDVASHTLTHPGLINSDGKPFYQYKEVQKDVFNIYRMTGTMPVGMAWPGGDGSYSETSIENVSKYTSVKFARGTDPTYGFSLPERFLKWEPTCSITDPKLFGLAETFLNTEPVEDMLFYVWGHGYELDAYDKYDALEELIKMMSENENVVCLSNTEFYLLFKDEIPSA